MTNKKFDFHDLPVAFFSDNIKANEMRNQVIKNQVRISECEQGDLENTFFSDENIELINKQLILKVFKKTQIKITPQSKNDLTIVMRYVFIEYAKHLPYDISGQIRELNCKVVGELFPSIISQVEQRIEYLRVINKPRQLVPLPTNTNGGTRQNLPSITTTFFST